MSAQSNLAGLFPPTGAQVWNQRIAWQPIPVHTLPRKQDRLLTYPILDCPKFLKLLKETMDSDAFKLKLKDYMDDKPEILLQTAQAIKMLLLPINVENFEPFLAQTAPKLGYDVKTLLDVNNHKLWNAYDTLLVQVLLINYYSLSSFHKRTIHVTRSKITSGHARIQGLLVKAILEDITKAATNADPKKMMMYSAHDITIVALQSALDVFDKKLPPYAACHLFELYQEANGQVSTQMQHAATLSWAIPFYNHFSN
ncbi:UNVERIFIED_CONTAM: hypothetical protein K2H54_046213 [Gekko kuhli]